MNWDSWTIGGEGVWAITYWEMALRVVLAVVAGGLIGMEREWNNRAAGFRTHILVCVGATMIMLLSVYGFTDFINEPSVRVDPARLAAQVISGIGFLGAGAIMRHGFTISGLTTAASLWVVAAIGLGIGAGFYFVSALTILFVLISLMLLNRFEKRFLSSKHRQKIEFRIKIRLGKTTDVIQMIESMGASVSNLSVEKKETKEKDSEVHTQEMIQVHLTIRIGNNSSLATIVDGMALNPDILAFRQVVTGSS